MSVSPRTSVIEAGSEGVGTQGEDDWVADEIQDRMKRHVDGREVNTGGGDVPGRGRP